MEFTKKCGSCGLRSGKCEFVNGTVHMIHMHKIKGICVQPHFIHTLSPSYSQVIPTMWITLWEIFTRST